MMNKVALYLFYILLFSSSIVFAQHPVFEHLTKKDGLPDIEFYDVLEDDKGYIWLAADKGLFRYDGKEFKNYTHPEKRALSVFGLKLDKQGRVWCNNITGQFFYVENDELQLFIDLEKEANGQLADYKLFKNRLIVFNFWYILSVDLTTKEYQFVNKNNFIASVYKRNDSLFYLSQKGLNYSFNGRDFKERNNFKKSIKYSGISWRSFRFDETQFHYSYDFNGHINKNEKGKLVLERNNQLIKVELPIDLQKYFTIRIFIREDFLWFCTDKGVYVCKYSDGKIRHVKSYFKNKQITKVIKDSNNNYWLSTLRDGIFIIPNIYLNKYESTDITQNISAMSKVGDHSVLFGSTNGYLTLLNTRSKEKVDIDVGSREKVFSIIGIDKNTALVSFSSNSILLDLNTLEYKRLSRFGNAKDFSLYNEKKIVFAAFAYASINTIDEGEEKTRIRGKRSYSTHYSRTNDKVYVGYVDGVQVYNNAFEGTPILHNNKPIFALDIEETNDGTIWTSTFKDGIIGIKNEKVHVNYTEKNGLLSNLTSVIKADGHHLWIATSKGIQVLNTKNGKLENLTKRDGVNSYNISDIAVFDTSVFFSSNKGVFEVNKDKGFKDVQVRDYYFSNILVDDKNVAIKDFYKLKYNENKIQFKLHVNGFLSEENVQCAYRLVKEGKKSKWDILDKGVDQITFNDLSAGKYRFELKALGYAGNKEGSTISVQLEVQLPFYKKWWFLLSLITVLFFLIWYRFNVRLKDLERKQEEVLEKERMQKQLVSSRLESLQAQMNPHFTFNALNSIQNLVLKGDKLEAYDYLTKFSLLIRENLNMSRKSFVSFEDEIRLLEKYLELEKLRFRNEFSYEILGKKEIGTIQIPTMIIQPYVENAIKHGLLHKKGNDKKVVLEFYKEKKTLICIVYDNGVGVEASKKIKEKSNISRESFSTKAIKERLSMLEKYYKTDIGVEYVEVNEGTKVIIKLPYNQ